MRCAYIVPAKVFRLLDGVWQLLVQRFRQEECTDSAQQKQGAQYIVGCTYIHSRAQIDQIRSEHANGICQYGAQSDARLTHARRIDLEALQIGREEGECIEELDERGQVNHQRFEALIARIHNDGQAGEERDEKRHGVGKASSVLVACMRESKKASSRDQLEGAADSPICRPTT